MKKILLAVLCGCLLFGWQLSASQPQPSIPTPPLIVAKLVLTHQTNSVGPANIFTPTHTGFYRVSAYAETTTPGAAGPVVGIAQWQDNSIAGKIQNLWFSTSGSAALDLSTLGFASGTVLLQAKAGTPITVETILVNPGAGGEYAVLITVERLLD